MKFTLEDIKNYLDEFDLEWTDAIIYDSNFRKYRNATINTFQGKPVSLYLKNRTTNKYSSAPTLVTDDKFIICYGGSKLDASSGWVEKLETKANMQV